MNSTITLPATLPACNCQELRAALAEVVAVRELRAEVSRRKQRREVKFMRSSSAIAELNELQLDLLSREDRAWKAAEQLLARTAR